VSPSFQTWIFESITNVPSSASLSHSSLSAVPKFEIFQAM